MRFGLTLPNNWGIDRPIELVDLAVEAEDRGFDSVWVNHHILNVGYVADRLDGRPYHDALTLLAWVGSRTSVVRLGTSVLVMPYLNPVVLAKTLATLDDMSGGRVDAGLGVGSLPEENEAVGVVDYHRRGAYTDESIAVLKALWTDEEPQFDGEFFSFGGLKASPKPAQKPHIPILIGGNKGPALRRVARLGDGWHPLGVSPSGMRARIEMIRAEGIAVGRHLDPLPVSLRWDLGAEPMPTPDIFARVHDYAKAGATEIVWSVSSPDIEVHRATLHRLADEVISAFG